MDGMDGMDGILQSSHRVDHHLRKEGPPEMEPLALLERRQQTTTMAVTRRIRKMLTANTTIITTGMSIEKKIVDCSS